MTPSQNLIERAKKILIGAFRLRLLTYGQFCNNVVMCVWKARRLCKLYLNNDIHPHRKHNNYYFKDQPSNVVQGNNLALL